MNNETPLMQPIGNAYANKSNKTNTNQLFMPGANPDAKIAGRDPFTDQYYLEDYLYG